MCIRDSFETKPAGAAIDADLSDSEGPPTAPSSPPDSPVDDDGDDDAGSLIAHTIDDQFGDDVVSQGGPGTFEASPTITSPTNSSIGEDSSAPDKMVDLVSSI